MTSTNQWQTTLLRAGSFRLDGGSMFGVIPKAFWSRWSPPDEHNRIRLDCNCVLLRDGDRTVLVEAGYGEKWSPKDRSIFKMEERTVLDALREVSVDPDEVTHVVLTHLHFDHAGAVTGWRNPSDGDRGGFTPSFPNAELIVQKRELEDALDNRSTMTRTYLKSHLEPVLDRFRTIDGAGEILPGIAVEPAPGHTWGQQAIHWSDTDRSYAFPGDLCPTLVHAHPSASMAYDVEPWTNMKQKQSFLEACIEKQRFVILDHDPDNPLATVVESEAQSGRFELEPACER